MIYIIVPVFNSCQDTKNFISSLIGQSDLCQLIIVNDGSTDETSKVIAEFTGQLNIVEIFCHDQWWGGSINFGWNWLESQEVVKSNDIIAFANNDITLPDGFINMVIDYVDSERKALFHPQVKSNDVFMSAGAKVNSWFPFITTHPKNITDKLQPVELGTARFLFGNVDIFRELGGINKQLRQYQGDNDFTLRALELGYTTYIVRDMLVSLNDDSTGLKSYNIKSIHQLFSSFYSLKSPNNIKVRFCFIRGHFNLLMASLITFSMTLNAFIKFIINRIKG